MKRFFSCLFAVSLFLSAFAQADDPVVMTVNGKDIHGSEFAFFFNKNTPDGPVTKKAIKEYSELFLNFKLKVEAAIDQGMDKNESFLQEFNDYRTMLAESYIIDTLYLENLAKQSYKDAVEAAGPDGLAYMYIISVIPEDYSEEAYYASAVIIDSVYRRLEAGEDFETLARKYSNDSFAARGGAFGWISRSEVPEEVADALFSLAPGEYSAPIAPDNIPTIVMAAARRQIGSYEETRPEIMEWLMGQDEVYADAVRHKANYYSEKYGWEAKDNDAVFMMDSLLEEIEPEFRLISQEYHDGLLMFDISSKEVWDKAMNDSAALQAYYDANRKKFKFDEPCFRGMVFFCVDEDVFKTIESELEGKPIDEWTNVIIEHNRVKADLKVMRGSSETGLFKRGQNDYVDKLVYSQDKTVDPIKGYPYMNVIGTMVKEPESIRDVAVQVSEAYQKSLEDQWIKKLRKTYKYKINRKALYSLGLYK